MKKTIVLSLVCFVSLCGEAVVAQDTTVSTQTTTTTRSEVQGTMIRKFVKRRQRTSERRDGKGGRKEFTDRLAVFLNVDVQFDTKAEQWRIVTEVADLAWKPARSVGMWVKYHEPSGDLVISLLEEDRNQWTLPRHEKIRVTIAKDKSWFKLEFLANFEGTNDEGYNYNWMKGSWLRVTRSSSPLQR